MTLDEVFKKYKNISCEKDAKRIVKELSSDVMRMLRSLVYEAVDLYADNIGFGGTDYYGAEDFIMELSDEDIVCWLFS